MLHFDENGFFIFRVQNSNLSSSNLFNITHRKITHLLFLFTFYMLHFPVFVVSFSFETFCRFCFNRSSRNKRLRAKTVASFDKTISFCKTKNVNMVRELKFQLLRQNWKSYMWNLGSDEIHKLQKYWKTQKFNPIIYCRWPKNLLFLVQIKNDFIITVADPMLQKIWIKKTFFWKKVLAGLGFLAIFVVDCILMKFALN